MVRYSSNTIEEPLYQFSDLPDQSLARSVFGGTLTLQVQTNYEIIMPFFDTYHFDPLAYSSGACQEAPAQQLPSTSSNPQAYPPPQTSSMQHSSSVGQSSSFQGLQTNPHAGPVHAGSNQQNSESWVEFEAWMARGLEAQKTVESKEERQRREAQETYAQKHWYSKKSSVYIWEQDDADPTFYCRTLLSKA